VQPRNFGPTILPSHLLLFLAVDCCVVLCKPITKASPNALNNLRLGRFQKIHKTEELFLENRSGFSAERQGTCTEFTKGVERMPNHKQRKKKDGANKSKKVKAMRAKEAAAKPAPKRSATGKPGQTSKFELLQDRPGALRRA